jgi:cell division protein FtsB
MGIHLGTGRWLLAALALVALALQAQLWFTQSGFAKTRNLRAAVTEQRAQNDVLRHRNDSLEAEVDNLKQSSEAAEERARTDLGMIGSRETFFQVVPSTGAT